ncbi:MAG: hypothetical protein GY858_05640 [Candidatus Omnitrophica bacterium]|nr:hypothetical protein [Candidatus Omnitrophota bacterium]
MVMKKNSQQQQYIIDEMKKSTINEFRYHYQNYDIGFAANFVPHEMFLEIEDLQEAFEIGMSEKEKQMIEGDNMSDLFREALGELFLEKIIMFKDSSTVAVTQKGEDMFIVPDRMYKTP